MKIIIFAGGIGSRMWPLSRENSPKQFDKIFNGKSTIQLAFERVVGTFGVENIFVQTMEMYREIIEKQLPKLPKKNIFIEPARRDVAPAVCFSLNKLKQIKETGPVAIIWADHLMDKVEAFTKALQAGEELIEQDPERFIFLAEQPRFANNNLGWMKLGKRNNPVTEKIATFSFEGWKYRPDEETCKKMYQSGKYFWNPGYFITSIDFLLKLYKKLAPEIYQCIVDNRYDQCPKEHFDTAIIEKVNLANALVIKTDMGWSDPGTLYALKEALAQNKEANVTQGETVNLETKDSLIYNLEKDKVVATIGLEGMVVVNTKDALVVVNKENVVKISKLVEMMKQEGLNRFL